MAETVRLPVWAFLLWFVLWVHWMKPVWATNTRGWKWISCDAYGRASPSRGEP